ncbi:MAG: 16S rRNA (cytosine(1402)-N(4))-methyltransferase RsmH [Verrucomicrobiaceae bacterium]|nr:16S rRNA (cytosine(1402)-N(4))-methyltransferase RsmH [Verrucomicrobiaceae bacterium]
MVTEPEPAPNHHKRRVRYSGKNPRRYEEKYKEHNAAAHPETVAKVIASGKTPAGQHLPIMVSEILDVLVPEPGQHAVDCTLGHGGHSIALLRAIQPGGVLLALDQDPIESARAEARLRSQGYPEDSLVVRRMNFAGLRRALDELGWEDGADVILADLGLSSMQIDNPVRGFSFKQDGPLDMRMNPQRGISARDYLGRISPTKLAIALQQNSDEPRAAALSEALAGKDYPTTKALASAVRASLGARMPEEERDLSVQRVFQAVRIEVNEEFTVLDSLLRQLPGCVRPGGRVAILTFHSGEDRRVKHFFREGQRGGIFSKVNDEVIRASPEEQRLNPRSTSAKLRWGVRAGAGSNDG